MSYHFTRLLIKNFGLHIEKEVHFKPGVNVLIGESETGKTTLIRAMNLLLENQPRGGEKLYEADNAKGDVYIELEDSLGNILSRSKNIYTLNGNEYRAVGSDVPTPIRKIFNLKEINWQDQNAVHFMLYRTGSSAAAMLNKATGMEEQELILKEIKNRISDSKSNIKRIKKNNAELQQTLERLYNVSEYMESTKQLKEQQNELIKSKESVARLDHILTEHYKIVVAKKLYEISEKHILKLNEIIELYDEWHSTSLKIKKLETLIVKIEDKQKIISNAAKATNHTQLFAELVEAKKEYEQSLGTQARLNDLIAMLQTIQADVFDSANMIKILEEEKQKAFKELGYCPLCERKIDNAHTNCRR